MVTAVAVGTPFTSEFTHARRAVRVEYGNGASRSEYTRPA